MKALIGMLIIFGACVALAIYSMARDYRARKTRVRTIVRTEKDERVIGEAVYPSERMRRLREIEPRGA